MITQRCRCWVIRSWYDGPGIRVVCYRKQDHPGPHRGWLSTWQATAEAYRDMVTEIKKQHIP